MESLHINATDRAGKYAELLPQLKALLEGESDLIANMANTAAAIHQTFGFHWVGFYLVKGNELVLGPFQGPVACTRIPFGKGVCGTAWKEAKTQLVPDVDLFPGHIACSALSKSEIVVPLINEGEVFAVLDIDSSLLNDFTEVDREWLEQVCTIFQT
jgi:L-methionine (R)-S-oxide reductase